MTFWQILRATTADAQVRHPLRKQLKRTAKEESPRPRRTLSGSNIVQRPFKESGYTRRRMKSTNGSEWEVAQMVGMLALQEPALRMEEVVANDTMSDITVMFDRMGIQGGNGDEYGGGLEKVAKIQKSSFKGYRSRPKRMREA